MAILSKIRERTIVLILVIALALFAFVVGDAFKSSDSTKIDSIGEVNGETINREDFSQRLENYKTNAGGRVSETQAMNTVWEGFVREQVFKEQLDKAGIVVGEKDVWESIINLPYFQNDPSFKNEAGLFDEEKVKEFIATMRDDAEGATVGSSENQRWANWLVSEGQIRQNVVRNSYSNLVNAGLGVTLEEGKRDYFFNNASVNSQYVYVPYSSIPDSLITITTSDYKNYINNNSSKYQVEKSRSLKYVKFDVVASEEDKKAIKDNLATFINDDEKFGTKGMKNSTDMVDFLEQSKSDLPVNNNFVFKSKLPKVVSEDISNASIGDVVGPYEDNGHYKLSKIAAIKRMPDSVKSRHILIPYIGTERSTSSRTKEAAKKTVDSIYRLVKNSSSRFIKVADEVNTDGSKGKGGAIGWISYDAAFAPSFDDDFATYLFENKKGDVQIVETKFGYHIIKIDDQKNFQNTVQLATLARQIIPSVDTENKFYQDAEIFASELSKGENFDDLVKKNEYKSSLANKMKVLNENVPGLTGNQRQIVRWAFENSTDIGSVKRFDIDNGYVVATLYAKTAEGLATVADVAGQIKPILINKKKAEMIKNKMTASTLEELASVNNVTVKTASYLTLASPTISGVGNEPSIVGAMSNATKGKVIKGIEGQKGVFAIKVTSKEAPTELDNYSSFRNRLSSKIKSRSSQLYEALKDATDIEDNRANIY
jgi:parvulin-like peptidyl-prolyl isomerase